MLAAIVDQGGLTEGADALGKSQPSVSRSLKQLESRVGMTLFEPGRRPLVPTDFCLKLAAQGRRIRDARRAASALIEQEKTGHSGAIRLAGTPFFMDGVVSAIIASFQSEHPSIRIDQIYGYVPDVISGIRSGTLDLGILPVRASEVTPDLAYTQILRGRNVVACRVGHPLSKKSTVRLHEIAGYPWIAPPPDSPLYHDLRTALEGIGVKNFKVSFSGGTLSAVTNILSGSDALTVLPYSVVFNMRRQNRLSALSVRIGDPDRHLGMLFTESSQPSPAVSRLKAHITSELRQLESVMQHQEQNGVWRR